LVQKISFLGGNIFLLAKKGTPPPFVKPLDLTNGTSVRSMMGLIVVRKIFNYFNFYSIDRFSLFFSWTKHLVQLLRVETKVLFGSAMDKL